mgnify:CR=1 FL=1
MRFLPTFVVRVELFAGCDITEVCYDLCDLAERIGCRVEAPFNGVKLWAKPGTTPTQLRTAWDEAMRSKRQHAIAQA